MAAIPAGKGTGNQPVDVLIIVTSDPRYDTRSSKFLRSLVEAGYRAKLIGVSTDGHGETSQELVRLPVHSRKGKLFFLQFYQHVVPEVLKSRTRIVIAGDLFSLLPAIINKTRYAGRGGGVKLIYDSKELYDELPSLKKKKTSFLFWRFVERASIRYLDSVFTVNDSIAKILQSKWNLPTTVVMNVPPPIESPAKMERTLETVYLAFSGGMQPGRGLFQLLDLLKLLPQKYRLKFIGDGSLRNDLQQRSVSMNLQDRIDFIGKVKSSEVVNELSRAHVGIYLMENAGLCHYLSLPNKLFQYIMARLPVVVPNFPEMKRVVEKYNIGAAVDPTNLKRVSEKIVEMTADEDRYRTLVRNCEVAVSTLNWETEKHKFLDEIGRIL